ncbi:MAG: Uncharacterized protein XD69_0624, partial [Clostridia bacterium 62_21]
MRRLQVVVEEWQYEVLRAIAARQGKSISAVLRQIIADKVSETSGKDPLLEVAGIAQAPPEKDLGSETIDE